MAIVNDSRDKKENMFINFNSIYKIAGVVIAFILMFLFISDILSSKTYLEGYKSVNFEQIEGINEEEMKHLLRDEIESVYLTASSLKGKKSFLKQFDNVFKIDVSGIKSNYRLVIKYMHNKFKLEDKSISVSLIKSENKYCYRIRKNVTLIGKKCLDFDSTLSELTILDRIIKSQALEIVRDIDPYILAMYQYKEGHFELALELAIYSLKAQPEARKYALGTIANCYKELKQYEESVKYYEKSILEFPKFYATKWRYAVMLTEVGKYEMSERLLEEVIRQYPEFKKLCLIAHLKNYCYTNNTKKFNLAINRYLSEYEIEEIECIYPIENCIANSHNKNEI